VTSADHARFTLGHPSHELWLADQADRLLAFHRGSADRQFGGFGTQDRAARLIPGPKPVYQTARMIYSYTLSCLLGNTDHELVEHGLTALRTQFRDDEYGGWFTTLGADGRTPQDSHKSSYAHAFVLLAAAAANTAGFSATDLFSEASDLFDRFLFDAQDRMSVESYTQDWRFVEDYRGINANMHSVEAFLAAGAATGNASFLTRARGIAERVIAAAEPADWRIPEHFDRHWRADLDYNRDRPRDQFRPYGATPGHGLEWSRLFLQVSAASEDRDGVLLEAARRLFARAVQDGWDPDRFGFAYTTDWNGVPVVQQRLHWPLAEAIAAARALAVATGESEYSAYYSEFWQLADRAFIDHEFGGWHHELDLTGQPSSTVWIGKSDLYHALQSCLFGQLDKVPGNGDLAGYLAMNSPD
jgi:mannose/cellobiose epimerase-like protein (N-acyl-D-glucosamine 2-epimerase family)